MDAELLRAIEQFNRREFYECHETLEALWLAEKSESRLLYQGVLQVGVAFHHLLRGNYVGAVRLLDRGLNKLRTFDPVCMGIDVRLLIHASEQCREELVGLGPSRVDQFDRRLIPRISVAAVPDASIEAARGAASTLDPA